MVEGCHALSWKSYCRMCLVGQQSFMKQNNSLVLVNGFTCIKNEHFVSVRKDVYDVLITQKLDGRFDNVRDVVRNNPDLKWVYM